MHTAQFQYYDGPLLRPKCVKIQYTRKNELLSSIFHLIVVLTVTNASQGNFNRNYHINPSNYENLSQSINSFWYKASTGTFEENQFAKKTERQIT